jgi:hypothetical protein
MASGDGSGRFTRLAGTVSSFVRMIGTLLLLAVSVVPAGQEFTCTPTHVWDGDWTCLGKVESFPEMKGKLDDQAEGFYERV